jgi:integrase
VSYAEKRGGALTGVWIAERLVKGERARKRCDTKADADAWERYVDATGTLPLDGTGGANKHSIGATAKRARAERPTWKNTRDPSLDQRIEVVLKFFGPTEALETITYDKLLQFVSHLEASHKGRAGKLDAKTINRYLSVVSAIVDFGRELKWTENAPKVPWQAESKGRVLYFKDWQDAPMLEALAERRLQVCYEVLAGCALRPTEFFSLKLEQIDVRNDWVWLRLWKTKNDDARSVPVDLELGRELHALVQAGTLPAHDEFYKALKVACRELGYNEDLNVYSLRHTGCTRAARKNAGAKVQKFAGHRDFKTTLKYIHLEDEDMADVAMTMRKVG